MTQARGGMSAAPTAASSNAPLSERFPVHTLWEFELEDGGDGGESSAAVVVEGRVHCTDEFSQTVVLKRPLPHTTLAWEVRFINASAVVRATQKVDDTDEETNGGGTASASLHRPLPKVHRRALEERERKALRQAEESFRQINQQATPRGQACFDRLLKACNVVAWDGPTIVVLHQVRVDPPYVPETCTIFTGTTHAPSSSAAAAPKKASEDASLERVRKIVAAVANEE